MKHKTSSKFPVHFLVENLVAMGLREVVISPGSRNAPLTIAFDEHPKVTCYLIHDERVAAFFGMGLAQGKDRPVAVICTSGSAVANYYPAITEAHYQCIPLLVISADRPEEWINQGDGQTIMQKRIFGDHVHAYLTISDQNTVGHLEENFLPELISASRFLTGSWLGPIHINFELDEPLYGSEEANYFPSTAFDQKQNKAKPDFLPYKDRWENAQKKLILVGQMKPNEFVQRFLEEIALDPSVVILVENTSNLKNQKFIHCIDRTLEGIGVPAEQFEPEIILTLGGAIVSKRIKKWIRNSAIQAHWRVGFEFPDMDTYRLPRTSFECEAVELLREINHWKIVEDSSFQQTWKNVDLNMQIKAENFLRETPYSDLAVFQTIFDFLPEFSNLHLANSSVVRYAQLFDPLNNVRYFSNRGTSGIDGSTSTALGVGCAQSETWNVLITGDISFFYDSNALWNQHLTPNSRIILINNGGGGIFKIIPGPDSTEQYLPYFVAEHGHTAKGICETFRVDYMHVNSLENLENRMEEFWRFEEEGRTKVLEVTTEGIDSHTVLTQFFLSLK